ncbi:senescence-associated carboxylesterase 101-like [Bidens hawaiensis]|uniref:senescence-associated carboxylesterase 101-like n=1 Tax=Bidens hawaiensis TaxID=980011 RepID=UPI004049E8B2
MAKDILAIHVSSVASEFTFSTGGRVVEPYRSSLASPLVEALICTEDRIGSSSKKINDTESPTDFDDIGKQICEKSEPSNMNAKVNNRWMWMNMENRRVFLLIVNLILGRILMPICITFGSPVIGDASFQGAIAERPQWKSRFLNVVAKEDPVASFFSSNTPYRPFGTYLFCTESGGYTTFEDQDSILLVLDAMRLWNACNLQIYDYANVWSSVRKKVLYRGLSEPNEFNLNSLRAGITLQLKEAGVLNDITDDEIGEMEKKQTKMITRKKMVNANVATKKLNDTKICLTYMEWYMKTRKTQGGYYDAYKNPTNDIEKRSCQEVRKIRGTLNAFWKKTVEEKDQIPQKEGTNLRKRWLYGGTTYRRMVEPLDIAEYYRMGKHNYMEDRSHHYKLLEKWSDEDKKNSKLSDGKRYRAASLTEDSCFWAHVEEAFISLRDMKYRRKASVNIGQKLVEFEAYVMREIKNYSVSPDIFLEASSFMKWWDEYKTHKGTVYASEFAQYMNNKIYESYQ